MIAALYQTLPKKNIRYIYGYLSSVRLERRLQGHRAIIDVPSAELMRAVPGVELLRLETTQ